MAEDINLKLCPRCQQPPDDPILTEYCGDTFDPVITIDCDCGISFYHHSASISAAVLEWNTRATIEDE